MHSHRNVDVTGGRQVLNGSPQVQLSLDLQSIDEALSTADIGVRAGVDILEVGTPLILAEGLHAVRRLHERYPSHPIVADLKTMDAGYLEAEMMFRAGASFVVVMARAHPATVSGAVQAAHEYNGHVMVDVMLCRPMAAAAREMERLGADVVIVHVGLDQRHAEPGLSPLHELSAVREAVSVPLQAVGGLSVEQAAQCPALGAPLVVIGAPLAIADHELRAGSDDDSLFATIRDFVTGVKNR